MLRLKLAIGLALVWAGLLLAVEFSGGLAEIAEPITDWQMTLAAAARPPDTDLALLAIDRIPSERPWPWGRIDYALVLHSLLPYGAQSMVMEVLLNDRDTQYTAFDYQFANVVSRYDRVIFSGALLRVDNSMGFPSNLNAWNHRGNLRELPLFQGLLWPLETFSGNSPVGIRNLLPEAGGEVRQLPLIFRYKDKVLPSLTLQAVIERLGADWKKSSALLGEQIDLKDGAGKLMRRIPIDAEGRLRLRYRVRRALPWTASFENVLLLAQQQERGEKAEKNLSDLRRRQVWIGRTDRLDFEPVQTVLGRMTPVEVEMIGVRQILDEDYLRPWPGFLIFFVFVGVAMGGGWALIRWGQVTGTVALVSVWLILVWASTAWFRSNNYDGPLLTLTLLMGGIWVAGLAADRWDLEEKNPGDKDQLPLDFNT
jgi:adenylate cyclase